MFSDAQTLMFVRTIYHSLCVSVVITALLPSSVPRPNVSISVSPIHINLHQQSCLWLVEFIHGVIRTITFDFSSSGEPSLVGGKWYTTMYYCLATTLESVDYTVQVHMHRVKVISTCTWMRLFCKELKGGFLQEFVLH